MTRDGVVVRLSTTLQYQLRKDELLDLFNKFGEDYESILANFGMAMKLKVIHNSFILARASMRDACGAYLIEDFYNSRGTIQDTLLNKTRVI